MKMPEIMVENLYALSPQIALSAEAETAPVHLYRRPQPCFIDLQWFAAEDEGRTEEPTETKIRKAREEEGRVVKSQDLIGAIGLLIPALAILFLAPYLLRNCMDMVKFYFLRAAELDPVKDRIVFGVFLSYFARLALPLLGIALATALFSNIIQVGFFFTTKPLGFKFERVIPNLGAYFQKTLFSANSLFNFFKSIFKMAIVGGVAFFLIRSDIEKLANLQTAELYLSVTTVAGLAIRLLIFTALLLLLLSIPDYMFQRAQFRESLKMSRQEVVEERKQDEGDPRIKQRLRRRMQELLAVKIREELPKADVVITNPTHFAVALQYNRSLEGPRVLVKGEDELALRIKRLASELNVPVVENKPLARALYAEVEIGDYVPVKYWAIIAEILKRVKTMDEYRRLAGL
ncbi:MAG: flagellar biosynthesis protein FlhB [Spirochaetaceae bacterium]|jgi:flagellar biosynthetic protein FlhB|nr:flagellar biosynthesis protein FlhB [Spirochaetaceae bacterium]